jgi:hypothetical protein
MKPLICCSFCPIRSVSTTRDWNTRIARHADDDRATEQEGGKSDQIGGAFDRRDQPVGQRGGQQGGQQAGGRSAEDGGRRDRRIERDIGQPVFENTEQRQPNDHRRQHDDRGKPEPPHRRQRLTPADKPQYLLDHHLTRRYA